MKTPTKFVPPPPMGTFGKLTRSTKQQGFNRAAFRRFMEIVKEREAREKAAKDAAK